MQYKKLKAVSGRVFYIYKRKKYLMRLYIKEGGLQIHPPRGFLGGEDLGVARRRDWGFKRGSYEIKQLRRLMRRLFFYRRKFQKWNF